jgi:hypothetical protein
LRLRRGVVVLSCSLLASCGGGGSSNITGSSSTPAPPAIAVQLTPAAGSLTFEYGPGNSFGTVTPTLNWSAQVIAPASTSEMWVAVRLLNEDGSIECLHDAKNVGAVTAGLRYSASGSDFTIPGFASGFNSPCGDTFLTSVADVQLTDHAPFSSSPVVLQAAQFSYEFQVTRTGYTPTSSGSGGSGGSSGGGSCGAGPSGSTAKCSDGSWSGSQHCSGTCSKHGGVACWVCPGVLCSCG